MNASLAVILEKLSKVEGFSEQGLGVLGELRGNLAAHRDGLAADWKEALANVSRIFHSSWSLLKSASKEAEFSGFPFLGWKSEVLRSASEDSLKDCNLVVV